MRGTGPLCGHGKRALVVGLPVQCTTCRSEWPAYRCLIGWFRSGGERCHARNGDHHVHLTYLLRPVRRLQAFLLQPLIQHAAGHRIRSGQLKFRLTGALFRNSLRQLGCGKPAGGVNLTV